MLESLKQEDLQFQELSPEEKQARGILARLTGPIASFTKGTRNGRKYSDKLWEKAFDAPLVKEMFKNGGLPGELQHPEGRSETDPTKIAIMMPEPPKKDAKGHLVASVDILDTPCGQIAYQLGKYGFKFGISSRGEGDLIQDFSGEESVDPDTYTLNAFDLVLIPACEDARLQFNESLETKPTNRLRTILSEALENATDVDRKIMEEALDELNIDDNWRYVETYEDNDIFFEPGTKKYIVGDLDSFAVLNSLKNAKEYIDRYNPDGKFFTEGKQNEEVYHLQYVYDTYDDNTDVADYNLRGHINVKASSEEEAIEKAKNYIDHHVYGEYNARHFRITDDRYTNVELVEEQIGRDETKSNEIASDILKNKPENKKEIEPKNETEVSVNINTDQLTKEEKDKKQLNENLYKGFLILQVGDCYSIFDADGLEIADGFKEFKDAKNAIEQELSSWGPEQAFGGVKLFEAVEDEEPERKSWDTDFHRLDIAYNHNFKQFDDRDKYSGLIRDFIDDLDSSGKEYEIYYHKTDPGCTIFFQESLNEDALDDSGIAIAPVHIIANMRSRDKFNFENGNMIQGKDLLDYFDPYDKVKIARSPGEIDKIVDVITESLNEDVSWDDLNGTEQSAVETALVEINNGSSIEDAVHGAVTMYNEENANPDYEDEEFYLEEANFQKVLNYVKSHNKSIPWTEPSDEQLAWEENNLSEGPDRKKAYPLFVKFYNAWPERMESIMRDNNVSEDDYEDLLSVPEDIQNILNKEFLKSVKDQVVYESKNYHDNVEIPTAAINMLKKYKNEVLNEGKYTKDELWDKFGTDDLDIINAGNEETVELKEGSIPDFAKILDSGYCNKAEWPEIKKEQLNKYKKDYKNVKCTLQKSDTKGLRMWITYINDTDIAADSDGAIIEQLQNILKQNRSLEEKIKKLQEKLSVGYAKEIELKEELDTYKQKVSKLSKKTKEIKVLQEKLSKTEQLIKNNNTQVEDKISNLNESILSKDFENKDLRKDISVLNESLDRKNSKIRSLNEQINKYKDLISSKDSDIEQLKEQYETGQKDLEQLKTQYSKKIEHQNQTIEKYQRVAKNSVKRYIESQAIRLGVKSDEIVNRLPKNYSFNDIDKICEDLQEYKFNMSNLPFSKYTLNENLKVTAKNIRKDLIEANPEDEITDYDLKIAEAFL